MADNLKIRRVIRDIYNLVAFEIIKDNRGECKRSVVLEDYNMAAGKDLDLDCENVLIAQSCK